MKVSDTVCSVIGSSSSSHLGSFAHVDPILRHFLSHPFDFVSGLERKRRRRRVFNGEGALVGWKKRWLGVTHREQECGFKTWWGGGGWLGLTLSIETPKDRKWLMAVKRQKLLLLQLMKSSSAALHVQLSLFIHAQITDLDRTNTPAPHYFTGPEQTKQMSLKRGPCCTPGTEVSGLAVGRIKTLHTFSFCGES